MMAEETQTWDHPKKSLRYEKGGNRRKHQGNKEEAEVIKRPDGAPVGLCPNTISREKAEELLRGAIPEYRKAFPDKPKALWTVYEGAVYRAVRSSVGLESWHGFPVKQGIPIKIEKQLFAEKTQTEEEKKALKKWLKS